MKKNVFIFLIALVVSCLMFFPKWSGGASAEVRLAAVSFRYGCALAWLEMPGAESKDEFVRRMAERALERSNDGADAPIWREVIRRVDEEAK